VIFLGAISMAVGTETSQNLSDARHSKTRPAMSDPLALTVSILSLAVSCTVAWLTWFRRGTVEMSQPTSIFFGHDGLADSQRDGPKVYLRTLLYSTSKRGRIVGSMHVSLARDETVQNFPVWVHGERNDLVRGSGLFVGDSGVSANHHFLLPEPGGRYEWRAGIYHLRVYALLVGNKKHKLLFEQHLEIKQDVAAKINEQVAGGVYFDWGPDASRYVARLDVRRKPPSKPEMNPEQFLAAMQEVIREVASPRPPLPEK
jgi:hypothetical protein